MIRAVLIGIWMLLGTTIQAETLRVAVTTSFENSGLAGVLLPQIKTDTGITVQLLVVGTGQAIRLGEAGDVDAILVHARAAEEAFVTQGHGMHRREIMYNDFVVIGPKHDPAVVHQADTIVTAFQAIEGAKPQFVSRGDDSGTHKAELALWAAADLSPEQFESWYKEVGAGMGAALNTAAGLNAYVLSDRASWLNFGNKADLALLFAGDPALFNQYTYIPVSADKGAHIRHDAALRLEQWLTSDTAKGLIDDYRVNDQQVFTFNAASVLSD